MPADRRAGRTVLDFDNVEVVLRGLQLAESTEATKQTDSIKDWVVPSVPKDMQGSYKPQTVEDEANRLAVLRDYMILESERESPFDQLTKQAASKFDVPWAIISMVDMGRQWFKSMHKDDIGVNETSREHSFCTHTIQSSSDIFVVNNALEDERFASNPFVTASHPSFRFYAGVPLEAPEGVRLGTFCVLDRKPRPNGLSKTEEAELKAMAKQTMDLLVKRKDFLWKENKILQRTSPKDKLPTLPMTPPPTTASKHNLSPRPVDNNKRTRTGSSSEVALQQLIPRPEAAVMEQPMIIPDPSTDGIDPDTYLSQLVEAIYGTKISLKTGLELGDFFPPITDEQMGAYSMDVVTMARTNDTAGLRSIYEKQGRDSLDCFNRFGEGLLNITCRRGFSDSVSFLLSDEINLNVRVRDDFGRTPLHDACWNPEPLVDICTKLMSKDPSLFFITDKRGYTPFQYARKSDWPKWRKFLFDRKDLLAPLMSEEIKSRFS